MQNKAVATHSDKFRFPERKPAGKSASDAFAEPLPVPEASESDSDTAWGLWEHTLRSFEGGAPAAEPAQEDFADTVPSDLQALQPKPPG